MHGQGLTNPVWESEDGRIIAGTLEDGTLILKTRRPDGSYLVDCVELVKREAA